MPHASVVGSLLYPQICTRLDIVFAVSVLGRFSSNPGFEHWVLAKKALRYLQRTEDFMLAYRKDNHLEVVGYAYADFARSPDERESTSRYIFILVGGAVSWKSVKQTLVASSTM